MAKKQDTSISASDHNLQKIGTKHLKDHLMATFNAGGSTIVIGRRGSGKTEICKQAIRDMHKGTKAQAPLEVYLNLSVLERVDLGGYPNVMGGSTSEYVDFKLPSFYKAMCEGDRPVIAILDEVDKADPSLWAPLLEFVQFRSVNGYKLKNLQGIVMTGNLLAEGGQKPSPPLLDRAEKYLVEPDYNEWLQWSGTEGRIHPSITAFINDNPKYLFGGVDLEDKYSDTSPRSWTIASNLLKKGDELGWSTDMMSQKVAGCVGKQAAVHYDVYFKHFHALSPIVAKVFDGKEKEAVDAIKGKNPHEKIVAGMMVASKFATLLDKEVDNSNGKKLKTPPKIAKPVGTFLSALGREVSLVAIRSNIQINKLIDNGQIEETPEWKPMVDEIISMVTGNAVK